MRHLILLLLLALPLPIRGADASSAYVFDDFGGRTDLLEVYSVARLEDGGVWFGTDRVLYGFDGYDVTAFACPDGPLTVRCLVPQPDGLLLGTSAGIYRFDPESGAYDFMESVGRRNVHRILADGDILYAGTTEGFFRIDRKTQSIERVSEDHVVSMCRVSDTLYLGCEGRLCSYSLPTGRMRVLLEGRGMPVVSALLPAGGDTLWLGTPAALLRYDTVTGKVGDPVAMQVVKAISRDGNGCLLVCTDIGIFRYDPESGEKGLVRPDVAESCADDAGGDIWFATDNGLRLLHRHPVLTPVDGLPEADNVRYGAVLLDSRGRLWLGGTQGLVLKDADGTVRHFTMSAGRDNIPHSRVRRIVEDRSTSTVYVATDRGYLCYNEEESVFEAHRIEGTHNWFYDLLPDRSGLWAATFEGVFHLDGDGKVLSHFDAQDGLSLDYTERLARDSRGDIWVLTRDRKVFRLDPLQGSVVPYVDARMPLSACMASDRKGRIWLASGQALLRLDRQDGSAEAVRIAAGGAGEVYALLEVGSRMWACTQNGISMVDEESLEVHDISTGRSYLGGCYDAVGGSVILGSAGAVDRVDLGRLQSLLSQRDGDLRLTGAVVNGERNVTASELRSGRLVLPHDQNHLELSFSDYDFNDELPLRFSYLLKGRRGDRSGSVTGNKLIFNDLRPGSYRLFVGSENRAGAGDSILQLRIRPPYYFSPLMLLLYLVLLSWGIMTGIRFVLMRRKLDLEKARREEIMEQSRQKEAFFQDVAHEFKTPLSLIIGPLGKLIKDAAPGTDVKTLRLVQDNAMKINTLIHHTIDYYNEVKGVTASLIKTEVEFVDFARSIFDSYRENYPSLEFIFTSSEAEIPVMADIVKMETVMNNLLSNACKYTPEGGSVLLTLDRDEAGGQLVVRVSDTGIGIPKEELPFAFQRYFESSRTKDKGFDSTGIGLSVIRKYVEMHGGQVSVDSDEEGTTFTIQLPGLVETPSDRKEESVSAGDDPDKPLVAIVDDNAQICNFIESLLHDRYRCVSSHNGRSGLKLCRDVLPDLVISDVVMPVMDGLTMCRQLRNFGPLSDIPIILLTAKGDRETEKKSIDLHIDVFLPKPFEVETLIARVDQLLTGKKRMEQRLRMEQLTAPSSQRDLSFDERYLQKATQLIEEHLDDTELTVSRLCELGGFNEKQLYRKIRQFTGQSVIEYIRSVRLKKAALLLQTGNYTVSEVLYSVGFSNASYFSRAFAAAYHMTPSDYMKSFKKGQS